MVQEKQQVKDQLSYISEHQTRGTSPDMTTVFFSIYLPLTNTAIDIAKFYIAIDKKKLTELHAWPCGRFIETQSNLRRKKLHRTNQGSIFPGGSFSIRDNVRGPIQFRREGQP